MKKPFLFSSLIVALVLSQSCAPRDVLEGIPSSDLNNIFEKTNILKEQEKALDSTVSVLEEPLISSRPQSAARAVVKGDLAINVSDVNFHYLIYEIANNYDISMITAQDVNSNINVSVNLRNESPVSAIKSIARAAGYVAVYNSSNNSITITPRAVYTFKLPVSVWESLGEGETLVAVDDLGVGSVAGKTVADIQQRLQAMLGKLANINVFPQSGIITVEGDVYTLDLAHDFLNRYIAITSSSLNIRAAVISINISEDNKRGVDWSALLGADVEFAQTAVIGAPEGFVVNLSSNKLNYILDLLNTETAIEILSQPQISLANLQSAALFSGERVPYLSEISTTTDSGVTTTSRSTEVANSGVLLQVTGDILDKKHVQMRVQPSVSSIREFRIFGSGDNQLTVPVEDISTSNSIITIESGQTIILGGVRSSSKNLKTESINDTVSGVFGVLIDSTDDVLSQKEFWILLNVAIAESVATEALIGEAVAYTYVEPE